MVQTGKTRGESQDELMAQTAASMAAAVASIKPSLDRLAGVKAQLQEVLNPSPHFFDRASSMRLRPTRPCAMLSFVGICIGRQWLMPDAVSRLSA